MDSRSPIRVGDKLCGNASHWLTGGLRSPVKPGTGSGFADSPVYGWSERIRGWLGN